MGQEGLNKTEAPSLLASPFQNLFSKSLVEAGIQLTLIPTNHTRSHPLKVLESLQRAKPNWDPSGACGHPTCLPCCLTTGPADLKAAARSLCRKALGRAVS